MVVPFRVVYVEGDQIGAAIAVNIRYGDPSALVFPAEPAWYRLGVAPTMPHRTVGVKVPADPVIAVVVAPRIVYVEDNQVALAVATDVCDGNSSALIFPTEPARHHDGISPSVSHVAVDVEVPTDAVVAVVVPFRVVYVEDD